MKWTIEKLQEEALKYKTRTEFRLKNSGAYQSAQRRKILKQICKHMPKNIDRKRENSPLFKWTNEKLKLEALKYKTRSEFQKYSSGAYDSAYSRNILNKICEHMPDRIDTKGEKNSTFKWTLEKLQEEALKYKTRQEFKINNMGAYNTARNKKILNQICGHMKRFGTTSLEEESVFYIIKQKYPRAQILKNRKVKIIDKPYIKGFDIDIYIPELKRGIEFDGTYWHSFEGLKRSRKKWPKEDLENYHKIKDDFFKSQGIEILHLKEQEWKDNRENCIEKCFEFLIKI
jgi:hypothetical protein